MRQPSTHCSVKLCSVVGSIPASLTYAVTHGNILLLLSLWHYHSTSRHYLNPACLCTKGSTCCHHSGYNPSSCHVCYEMSRSQPGFCWSHRKKLPTGLSGETPSSFLLLSLWFKPQCALSVALIWTVKFYCLLSTYVHAHGLMFGLSPVHTAYYTPVLI